MDELNRHPSLLTLKAHALGQLAGGMDLLVSSHLTFCPRCRGIVAGIEEMSAATLRNAPAPASAPSLADTLAKLDAPEPATPVLVSDTDSIFPTAMQRFVPGKVDEIHWSRRLPGLYECELPMFEGEKVSLLKVMPGTSMLAHTHEGDEATLILQGQMTDGDKVYNRGDVAQADHDDDHSPHITGTETCICLIVMSGKVRFTGTLGRALNVLVR